MIGWAIFGAGVFVFLATCVVCATVARVQELKNGYIAPAKQPKEPKKNPGAGKEAPAHREESSTTSSSAPEAPADPTDEQIKDIVDAFIDSTRHDVD